MKGLREPTTKELLASLFRIKDKHVRRVAQIDKQIDDLIRVYMKEEKLLIRPRKERVKDAVLPRQ
jgi:hypothetical protein